MPPITPKKRNVLFGSNKQHGKDAIPHKTQILRAFLRDPPKKIGEFKKYKIREGVFAILKKEKIPNQEYTDYYKLTIMDNLNIKHYFVKEVKNKTLLDLQKLTGYNEYLALSNKLLRKELEDHGLKVINVFYGFEHKASKRNFVVTEYMNSAKYETIDSLYINKKITLEEYKKQMQKLSRILKEIKQKGFNVDDIGAHNVFVNKQNPKELIVFDIMLDLNNINNR
jgi:hypothetical protein